jgi:hypothetical protein
MRISYDTKTNALYIFGYYTYQIGMLQLADSGAPIGCVVLNGKQYEPNPLEPMK